MIALVDSCASLPSNAVSINVIPMDELEATATATTPICEGADLRLSVTEVQGAIYEWMGPNGFISNDRTVVLTTATPALDGVYRVNLSLNDCAQSTETVIVQVTPAPSIPSIASNKNLVCSGERLVLRTDSLNGENTTYDWFFNNLFFRTTEVAQLDFSAANASNAGNYSVLVRQNDCASNLSEPLTIEVIPPIQGEISLESSTGVCLGESLILDAPLIDGATYEWTGPNEFLSLIHI